jgi:hypothetical protein
MAVRAHMATTIAVKARVSGRFISLSRVGDEGLGGM